MSRKRATAAPKDEPVPGTEGRQVYGKKLTLKLPVPLTDEELAGRTHELRQAMERAEQLEAERAQTNKTFKAKIDDRHLRARTLAKVCDERAEDRDVECVEVKDFAANSLHVVRLDTNALTGEPRAMTAEERQVAPLFPTEEPAVTPEQALTIADGEAPVCPECGTYAVTEVADGGRYTCGECFLEFGPPVLIGDGIAASLSAPAESAEERMLAAEKRDAPHVVEEEERWARTGRI